MLGDVDADGTDFEHGSIVRLQAPLGAVEGLGLGDTAFHDGSSYREGGLLKHSQILGNFAKSISERKTNAFKLFTAPNDFRFFMRLKYSKNIEIHLSYNVCWTHQIFYFNKGL